MKKLKLFGEVSQIQLLAKSVFDFGMDDNERFKLLWQFVYLSFFNQDIMIFELKCKQDAEDFQRINTFQQEGGFIAKKEAPKVYRLFKLFCLKNQVCIQHIYEQS